MKILLVEDSPSDADLLQETLRKTGEESFEFTWAERLDEGLASLSRQPFDVLLLDLSLPDSTGPDTFLRARQAAPELPIVLLTGSANEDLGLVAVRSGVQDYLVKGQADGRQIARTIRYAIERKAQELEVRKLNRTLRALGNSNQALMRARSEPEILEAVCRIIVEDCGHAMVWIGYAEDAAARIVRPMACAGLAPEHLETLRSTRMRAEEAPNPAALAIRTGQPWVGRNLLDEPLFAPWRALALEAGYASCLVLPLAADGQTFGAISIHSRQPDPFSEDEAKLLTELAGDVAHGVKTLRLRQAHARAEEALRQSHQRLDLLAETADALLKTEAPEAVVDSLCRRMLGFLDCDVFLNFVAEDGRSELRLNASAGISAADKEAIHCRDCAVTLRGEATRNGCRNFALSTAAEAGPGRPASAAFALKAYACHPLIAQGRVLGTLFFGTRGRTSFTDDQLSLMKAVADQVAIAIERRRTDEALRHAHDELEQKVRERTAELVAANAALQSEMAERRSLEARILGVSEAEQRRIGQDLHDGLCQQLAGIAYLSSVAQDRLARKAPDEAGAVARISELVQEANQQAHGLARGLCPVSLEADGLMAALRSLAAAIQKVYPITARFECKAPVLLADPALATQLYRIAQEALSNAAKHSKATRVTLRLAAAHDTITLAIKDNGRGLPAKSASPAGMGLETMRFRARSIGATLQIQNDPKGGVLVTCSMPAPPAITPTP